MTTCYPMRAPRIASRVLDGEAILMNPADSSLFSLNATATLIWQAADGRTSLEAIAAHIAREFEIDAATALADARELAEALASHQMLMLPECPQ